jgi:glucosamine-6-phosphate deaminase
METIIKNNHSEALTLAADMIEHLINKKKDPVLGLTADTAMQGLYAELIKRRHEGRLDFSRVKTFNIDEYAGLPDRHPASLCSFMIEYFFGSINISPENINIPNGNAIDMEKECLDYEDKINKACGIDLLVLNLETNGGVGFNNPGTSLGAPTHVTPVHMDKARMSGSAIKLSPLPAFAVTMGMGTVMRASQVILLALGAPRAVSLAKAVEGPVTSMIPASVLQMHPDAITIADKQASARLKGKYPSERQVLDRGNLFAPRSNTR